VAVWWLCDVAFAQAPAASRSAPARMPCTATPTVARAAPRHRGPRWPAGPPRLALLAVGC